MVIRIVKMVFREEEIEAFKVLFNERKSRIRQFDGCTRLELWQDQSSPATFFTYSWWNTQEHLDAYRASPFFNETWSATKEKFAARPEAWSVNSLHQL